MPTTAATAKPTSFLSPTQRYAAGALLAIALNQAQIHQTRPLGLSVDFDPSEQEQEEGDRASSSSSNSSSSVAEDPELWVHENSGLLRPIFRYLGIDSNAWHGLEETAGSSPAKNHVGAFLRLLSEDNDEDASNSLNSDQELALSKAVDAMSQNLETSNVSPQSKKEKHKEYENECREKLSSNEVQPENEAVKELLENAKETHDKLSTGQSESNSDADKESVDTAWERDRVMVGTQSDNKVEKGLLENLQEGCDKLSIGQVGLISDAAKESVVTAQERDGVMVGITGADKKPIEEEKMLSYQRKITVLYEILSGCLADKREGEDEDKKCTRRRKGYDARHRVALRLLATWLDIKWTQMEAIETIIACSAMAVAKEEEAKEEESRSTKSKWAKWRRGGIIGAAAITGGTLMAITGGLAAPAIAAGFSALAPTLGTLIPVIGASGFAAAASAAGTVAGSVAVAASFGAAGAGLAGTKMARRTGNVDEFEFKAIGENHNQGRLAVEILVSGFVFDEKDFFKPWEGKIDNLERYVLRWESKNLIAVSTAIQDWLTSSIALTLMKQGAMMTVLSTLLTALAWPATLLLATDFIDSKWSVAIDRSDKAGRLLAEVLLKGLQGNRPVTLVGYSLGARVIFKCLETLAETEHNAEVVERVVLLGAPISIKDEKWGAARKMVAGRFMNAYSTNDWILGVAFRASLLSQGLAGIQPINVPGIENIDVTDIIEGHSSYLWATQKVLEGLELDAYYPVFRSSVRRK